MNAVAGLWIDHRKAIVVNLSGKNKTITEIPSNAEPQREKLNGKGLSQSFEMLKMKADDKQQRSFTKKLNDYYTKVADSIRGAEAVLIMGPGEAKGEFKTLLDKRIKTGLDAVVLPADKMSERQIIADTRRYFKSAAC